MKQILESLESIVTVVLVFTGIAGLSYHAFRDGGWVEKGFGKITSAYIEYPIIAFALTAVGIYAIIKFRQRKVEGRRYRYFDYIIYALMVGGIYFIGNFIVSGEF